MADSKASRTPKTASAIRELLRQVDLRNQRLAHLAGMADRLTRESAARDQMIYHLEQSLAAQDQALREAEAQGAARLQELAAAHAQVVQQLEQSLAAQDQALREAEAQGAALSVAFQAVETSIAWKLIVRYRTMLDRLAPPGTLRRRVYRRTITEVVNLYRRLMSAKAPTPSLPTHAQPVLQPRGGFYWRRVGESVDIIVPVYNGLQYVKDCLRSILAHTDLSVHDLVIIDDASTEPGIHDYLADFQAKHAPARNVTLLIHRQNQGFVRTANEGFRRSARDVILLNSDTLVTAGWVDKLQRAAYSDWNVATVTPFSNNATICSVPEFAKENDVPVGFTVDSFAALVENVSLRYYPRIPTAVGFCMYVRRKALDEVGLFDEVRFGRGYGEENDFCMRASRQGWVHILDDATYVYHLGGASFTNTVKHAEVERHLELLDQLYPDYRPMVHRFIAENPLGPLHSHLRAWLNIHSASGG